MSKAKRRAKNPTPAPAAVETPVETVVVETTVAPTPAVAPATSIRKTINTMLADGKSTKEITAVIQATFPGTAAAAKPAKHISHYRCLRKRELKRTVAA